MKKLVWAIPLIALGAASLAFGQAPAPNYPRTRGILEEQVVPPEPEITARDTTTLKLAGTGMAFYKIRRALRGAGCNPDLAPQVAAENNVALDQSLPNTRVIRVSGDCSRSSAGTAKVTGSILRMDENRVKAVRRAEATERDLATTKESLKNTEGLLETARAKIKELQELANRGWEKVRNDLGPRLLRMTDERNSLEIERNWLWWWRLVLLIIVVALILVVVYTSRLGRRVERLERNGSRRTTTTTVHRDRAA